MLTRLLHTDVSNSQEISSMVSWLSKNYSGLDILVNSAGASGMEV